VFHNKCKRWESIAQAHLLTVWTIAGEVLYNAVQAVAPNDHTAIAIWKYLIEPKMKSRREEMKEKLKEIIRPHVRLHAITYDPEFSRKKRDQRDQKYQRENKTLVRHIAGEDENHIKYVEEKLSDYQRPA